MKILVAVVLSCIFAGSVCVRVSADDQGVGKGGKMTAEQRQQARLDKLTRILSLTSDQQGKISELLTEKREKMKSSSKTRDEMKTINDDYNAKVKTLLTSDQLEKYEKLLTNEKHLERQ
jgi:Spy/CpxP family protein refolding chaperone